MSDDAPTRPAESAGADAAVTFTVAIDVTERLDRFLADQLQLSRTYAARLIGAGLVTIGDQPLRASRLLQRGDEVTVRYPEDEPPRTLRPNPIDIDVVYEDEFLAVIDKPAGLVVHPAPGHWDDTLVNALVARGTTLAGGAEGRPGIVHRLDRDTSGLMVVAKTDAAHRRLGAMLAARRIRRGLCGTELGPLRRRSGHRGPDCPASRRPQADGDSQRRPGVSHRCLHRRPAGADGPGPARTP